MKLVVCLTIEDVDGGYRIEFQDGEAMTFALVTPEIGEITIKRLRRVMNQANWRHEKRKPIPPDGPTLFDA